MEIPAAKFCGLLSYKKAPASLRQEPFISKLFSMLTRTTYLAIPIIPVVFPFEAVMTAVCRGPLYRPSILSIAVY